MTMNEKGLRELDAWIGVNVFGMKAISKNSEPPTEGTEDDYFVIEWIETSCSLPHYSTDPAAAFQVLQRCADKLDGYEISVGHHRYKISEPKQFMVCSSNHRECQSIAPTLEIAICKFAKELFKDQTK